MELKNDKVVLRDFIEADIDDKIYWETVETEWQLWDAPWENEEGDLFDAEAYRRSCLERLAKVQDPNRMRWGFQICLNDESRQHIGWCNAYRIDDNYAYTEGEGNCAIGIGIPVQAARRQGFATAAWDLFIQYLLMQGIESIYTQTWSGNERVLGLIKKVGFEECNRVPEFRTIRGQKYDGLTFKLNMAKYQAFRSKRACGSRQIGGLGCSLSFM